MTVAAGEEALIPSPAWPNFAGAIRLAGARPVFVPLERGETRWRLDPDRLAAAVTPATRVIFVNSPANPTGFVATHEELAAALAIARRHNLWIVADEIYGRLTFSGARAPSFHDVMARGRQDSVRPDAVEELGDDRLAARLARGAAGACRR